MRKALILLLPLTALFAQGKAPGFTLKDLAGHTVVLDSLLGKGPIVVDFWAVWCVNCDEQLDLMQGLYEELKDRGLLVLAISQDGPRSLSRVRNMVKSHGWTFPVLLDPDRRVGRAFKVFGLPTTYVLDPEGNIIYRRMGFLPAEAEEIHKLVQPYLRPPNGEESE